jgi:hypothetical protein
MKKLKNTKKLQNEVQVFQEVITNYCNKINKEYAKNMNELIKNIAKGENLDVDMLKEKYLKTINEKVKITPANEIETDTEPGLETENETELETETVPLNSEPNTLEEIIFDKIVIDETYYYYENKDN